MFVRICPQIKLCFLWHFKIYSSRNYVYLSPETNEFNEYYIMKRIKKNSFVFLWIIPFFCVWGCSENPEIEPDPPEVKLSADKTSIKANNKDETIFTVTVDGEEITSSVIITQSGNTIPVEGMHFSTDSAASYTFYATYHDIQSNEITIDAIEIDILLTVDKQSIKANNKDIVTFSITADEEDVTPYATIIQAEVANSMIVDAEFHTRTPGTYTFYAVYEGKKSNEVEIDASAVILSLSVDKTTILANNSDKVTITVMADDENVTSDAMIILRSNKGEELLESPEFLTDEVSSYTFYAIYDNKKSNEIRVEATYVELTFLRSYCIIEITSNTCPNCPLMTEELKKKQQSLPGRIHLIAMHPFGSYCYSELAGALAATANNFADRANTLPPPPPVAMIDLFEAVNLYPTTTGKRLDDALDRVTRAREWASLTGMAIQSQVTNNVINFTVNFKTNKTGAYRFFAFIVEDGVVHRQILSDRTVDTNYVHNSVGTYQLAGDPFVGVNLGTIETGHEVTRNFSIRTDDFDMGKDRPQVNLANCRIVGYTFRTNDGANYFVDNVTTCPVNGSVRYLYEK